MSSTPVVAVETPESSNSFGRMFGALVSPRKTFESIARRPTWLAPVVLGCLVGVSVVSLFGHRVGWRGFFEKQLTSSSAFQQLPVDQQEQRLNATLKYGPKAVYVQVVIAPFLGAVIIAAVFLGLFNGLAGTRLNFKTALGVVAYGGMPRVIVGLLGILVLLLKDPTTIDLQHLVASNAGVFASSNSPGWLVAMLTTFDLFSFWVMILMAIGYSAAAPKKLSFGKAFAWIFSAWLVYVLVAVGFTAAFS